MAKDEKELCGHINKQFYNKDGVREDLSCTLPKGHAPVSREDEKIVDRRPVKFMVSEQIHEAQYEFMEAYDTEYHNLGKGRVTKKKLRPAEGTAKWLDGAGS